MLGIRASLSKEITTLSLSQSSLLYSITVGFLDIHPALFVVSLVRLVRLRTCSTGWYGELAWLFLEPHTGLCKLQGCCNLDKLLKLLWAVTYVSYYLLLL